MKRTLLALVALLFVALPAWAIPPFPPQNIDGKCDESVFGSSIGTGLLLDSTTLKVSSILQKYHGVDPSANVLTLLGAANFSAFRTSLSLVPGSDVQAYNGYLADIAALSPAVGDILYFDGTDWKLLLAGTSGYFLKAAGAAAPAWSNTLTGTFGGFTASRLVQSNASGNLESSTVTTTEAGYLSGKTLGLLDFSFAESSDATLATAGQMAIRGDEDRLSAHLGTGGEIAGEATRSFLYEDTITFDPSYAYDQESTNRTVPLFTVSSKVFPNGIIIDYWSISYNKDPTTELDANIKYADAQIGLANAVTVDAIDTTNGASSEDTDANINSGSAIPAGKFLYISFDADPTDANVICTFTIIYHAEED